MLEEQKKPKKKIGKLKKYPKTKFSQGLFVPTNPQKYVGNVHNIVYRSSWEHGYMRKLDLDRDVIAYSSEEIIIPYKHPIDGRVHRYFPDFMVQRKNLDGSIDTVIVEIKPHVQTQEPKIQKRKTKRLLTEVTTFAINRCKWDAAIAFCKSRGWRFEILTEKHLRIF